MERNPRRTHGDPVVGGCGAYAEFVPGGFFSVFQRLAAPEFADRQRAADDLRRGLLDIGDREGVQVVAVMVGDQDQVGFRKPAVIGYVAVRIDVDDFVPVAKHYRSVTDVGHLERFVGSRICIGHNRSF